MSKLTVMVENRGKIVKGLTCEILRTKMHMHTNTHTHTDFPKIFRETAQGK